MRVHCHRKTILTKEEEEGKNRRTKPLVSIHGRMVGEEVLLQGDGKTRIKTKIDCHLQEGTLQLHLTGLHHISHLTGGFLVRGT